MLQHLSFNSTILKTNTQFTIMEIAFIVFCANCLVSSTVLSCTKLADTVTRVCFLSTDKNREIDKRNLNYRTSDDTCKHRVMRRGHSSSRMTNAAQWLPHPKDEARRM
jgi:hypothetical protein